MNRIAVLGAGSWGTALAVSLGNKGHEVCLWARRPELAEDIEKHNENKRYLPGVGLPPQVTVVSDLRGALDDCGFVVLSVPSHGLRDLARTLRPYLQPGTIIVNTAKGIENHTLLRMSQVLAEELPDGLQKQLAVLSGPSHAEEVGRNLPTAVVVAAPQMKVAEIVQDTFMSRFFRVYINSDLLGVEIAGSLKNAIALGTGISEGLGYGDNTKAALITRGLAEITRLGLAMGVEAATFAGLAGIGDLVVTCTSMHSRNRRAGIKIGQGEPLHQVLEDVGMVVEGINTTRAAYCLAKKYGVEMPIIQQAYQVLFEGKNAREAVVCLMTRSKTHEGEKEMLDGTPVPFGKQ